MIPAGPAASTRGRTALGDISNVRKYAQLHDGKNPKGLKPADQKAASKNAPSYSSNGRAGLEKSFDEVASRPAAPTRKETVDKVDALDCGNAQAVIPYLVDIHRHYRESEVRPNLLVARQTPDFSLAQPTLLASATFMETQKDVNEKMRAILIDWLVEVHLKFKLMVETLYLTVNLIDRFLEKEPITRNKLQLVGVTAMFIASKYEEIYAPECRDFVYISDKAYTREQILSMEGLMLSKLGFQLTTPNAFVFLKRYCKVAGIISTTRSKTELLAHYLVELTLQEYKMLQYLPSTIAASAVYLALKTMGQTPWTAELKQHSCYTEAALLPCARDMHALHKNAPTNNLQAVRKKFAQEKHGA
ncbi:MAG: hypothetical protein SGPRY_004637, partial [Prymnesium sp.]